MGKYSCSCHRCTGCLVSFRWQSQVFILRGNGRWENIVTWDKGYCLPCALVFVIETKKMTMEGSEGCIQW
jgi:hypothetical protein